MFLSCMFLQSFKAQSPEAQTLRFGVGDRVECRDRTIPCILQEDPECSNERLDFEIRMYE